MIGWLYLLLGLRLERGRRRGAQAAQAAIDGVE